MCVGVVLRERHWIWATLTVIYVCRWSNVFRPQPFQKLAPQRWSARAPMLTCVRRRFCNDLEHLPLTLGAAWTVAVCHYQALWQERRALRGFALHARRTTTTPRSGVPWRCVCTLHCTTQASMAKHKKRSHRHRYKQSHWNTSAQRHSHLHMQTLRQDLHL